MTIAERIGTVKTSAGHCDNCAATLYQCSYVSALVHGEEVICCSGRCVARLQKVWAPAKIGINWRKLALVALILAPWFLR